MKTGRTIRKRFIVFLLILSAGPLLTLSSILLWQSVSLQQRQIEDSQMKLSMLAMQNIENYAHEQEIMLRSVIMTGNLLTMGYEDRYAVLSRLITSPGDRQHRDIFNQLTLLDEKGRETASVSRSMFLTRADLGDRSVTDEFSIPAASGITYFSPVRFEKETGEPLMKMSIPITDARTTRTKGVLVADIRMKYMWNIIENIKVGETGTAYMLDHRGRVIAHPNPTVVLKGTIASIPRGPGITYGLTGKPAVLAAQEMRLSGQTFHVVTELPLSEALKHAVRSLLIIAVFLVITLSGVSILGFLLVRRVISPIESLAGTARAISRGDFTQEARVESDDEIGTLSDSFNIMTSRLLETISSLEKEIAERRQADEVILHQNVLLNNILNSLTHPFYVIDANDYTIKLANAASRFGEITGDQTCYSLTHHRSEPCQDREHPCILKKIKESGRPETVEHLHYDKDGNLRISEVHGYPVFDGGGNIIQVIEYNLDITKRKKDEEMLMASLREKDILLREIHHRVKNNMQIISSLLSLQAEIAGSEKDRELLSDSQNRIRSMSLIHEKLYRSKDMANIDISDYIKDLTMYILQFHKTAAANVGLRLELENIWIGIDTAIPCGLIINELVTNSLKHAFPDNRKGEIKITIRKSAGDEITLLVSDDGIGIPPSLDIDHTRSLGLMLVNTLTKDQLQGRLELDRTGGTAFRIMFKEIRYKSRM